MSQTEQIATYSGTTSLAERVRSRLFPTNDDKERKIIDGLPPMFLRLFGDIDYAQQLNEIPAKFRQKVVILTTSDTSDEIVESLRKENWQVVRAEHVSTEQARENSSLILNEGLQFARIQNYPYAFFLSSGFQRHIGMFYSMFYAMQQKYQHQDAYYFILPETHRDVTLRSYEETTTDDIDAFLSKTFPYETALFLSTRLSDFETNLSIKGNLGITKDGIPLGGMEFLLTLLDNYKREKDRGEVFSPKLLGITLPILLRSGQKLLDFYRETNELSLSELSSLNLAPSLEVTPNNSKTARRVDTWRAAMSQLGLTDLDIQKLFSQTRLELGMIDAFRFEDMNTTVI